MQIYYAGLVTIVKKKVIYFITIKRYVILFKIASILKF